MLSLWGKWSVKNPFSVLLALSVLMSLAFYYTANHLSINTDTTELVAPDAPFQQTVRKFEKAFPQDMRTLLLVVESGTPELTKSATQRLSRLLGTDTAHFDSVYTPNDNVFFRQNGLLYLDMADLQNLSATLSQAQPFIGRIAQETHLSGFFAILDDALSAANDNKTTLPLDLPVLVNKITRVLHQTVNGENSLLSWQELIAPNKTVASKNSFIMVRPKLDYSQIRPAETAINAVRKAVAAIQEPDLPAVKVSITGEVGLEDDELSGMSTGTFNASLFSLVVVLGILLLAYRSVWLTLATLVTLALGMILCGAFAAAAVKELNLISIAFAVSNIGLGVEYAIHFCLRYRDNLSHHINKDRAIIGTLTSTSPSLLLCAGTTAIGLYAFIPTDYQGVSELGLLAGTSLFICLLVTLILLPVLLKLIPQQITHLPPLPSAGVVRLPEKLALFTLHHAKAIALTVVALAVISLWLMPKVATDFNPINLRDPNTESVIAFKNLTKDKDTTPMTLTVLAKDEASLKSLQQQLATLATVDKTLSLFDFLPADQEDKLALIEEMDLMMGLQAKAFPDLKMSDNPVAAIQHLLKTLDALLPNKTNAQEIALLTAFKSELQGVLLEYDARLEPHKREFIDKTQTALLGTLPPVMNELLASFNAKEIALADLPPAIRDRWLSPEGEYRLQIFPKQDLNDLTYLEKFITDVQTLAPDTTDLPIVYWESMKAVIGAFKQAITIALITIALVLFGIRRNLTDTVLIMTPLVLAGLFTMASTVLTHTPINFANIIALPLLLGFGVDNGIHMVEKLRHSASEEQNIYQSSTARAMFYGALTTSSSFAGLAFSPHEGIASMGLVITMGIFWIMVSTFVILPAFSHLVLKSGHAKA
jgi:hopanoid biosynthesis associated RND transporter like protein HpnN